MKIPPLFPIVATALACVASQSLFAATTIATRKAIASASPRAASGTDANADNRLRAYASGGVVIDGWLRFDLSDLPTNATVTNATLTTFTEGVFPPAGSPIVSVYYSTYDAWVRGGSGFPATFNGQAGAPNSGPFSSVPLTPTTWTLAPGVIPWASELGSQLSLVLHAENNPSDANFMYWYGSGGTGGAIDPTGANAPVLTLTLRVGPSEPTYTALFIKNGAVPGAGNDSRIQAGALWTGFGTPAVNGSGQVACVGKWKAPAIAGPPKVPAQSGTGIFIGDTLLVAVNEPVPGIDGAKFKAFKDPVIDDDGHVAFLATISGSGVTTGSDSVVVSTGRNGSVEVLAREGGSAPDAAGAVFKSFQNVSITGGPEVVATAAKGAAGNGILLPSSGGCTVFTATLSGSVDKTNDTGAWWLPAGAVSVELMIREGQVLPDGLGNVKTFQVLKTVGGSPGQGRGLADGNSALIQVTSTTTGTQAQLLALPGSLSVVAATGDVLGGSTLPAAQWSKMSLPSTGGAGQFVSVLGELKKNIGGVTGLYTKGIFASEDSGDTWEPVVRVTDAAPGFDAGAKFTMFKDPVNSSTGAGVAFIATAKGGAVTTASDTGIWWQSAESSLSLVAREGTEPPGAPEGAKWKSFDSVALPGGETGPLFVAKLVVGLGEITTAGDVGLYGVDSAGAVRALLREGTSLLGKTVKTFNVLKAVAGVNGSSRSFNKSAAVVALVTYTDASVGIVKIDVP